MYGIFSYIYHKNQPNYVDPMGNMMLTGSPHQKGHWNYHSKPTPTQTLHRWCPYLSSSQMLVASLISKETKILMILKSYALPTYIYIFTCWSLMIFDVYIHPFYYVLPCSTMSYAVICDKSKISLLKTALDMTSRKCSKKDVKPSSVDSFNDAFSFMFQKAWFKSMFFP